VGRRLFPRVLDVMEARSAVVLRSLAVRPEFAPTTRSWIPFLHKASGVVLPFRVPLRVVEGLVRPEAGRRRVARFERRLLSRLVISPAATADQRLDDVQLVLSTVVPTVVPTVGPTALVPGFGMLAVGARLARPDLRPGDLATVLRALPHNVTTQMDLQLWALAQRVRDDGPSSSALSQVPAPTLAKHFRAGALPRVLQDGLVAFLDRWGDRAVAEIDVGVPRWSDDPAHVLTALAGYLRLDGENAPAPDEQFRRGGQAAAETVQRLAGDAARRGRWRGALVGFALRRARSMAGLRETPKFLLVRLLGHVRRQLALVGDDLVRAGALLCADDVFFLTLAEARSALRAPADLRALVAARREAYARELRRRHVPRVMLSDGTEPEAVAADDDSASGLRGTPASPGTVTAPARVVLDPSDARLSPGDVLVAPSTDPGWTPLFLTAGGLVMEMGGANSHGAVVAREYGIPAVVGVPAATHVLRDGEVVMVDGGAGTVTPV
jgi:pyruvate,water dikinase